MKKNSKKRVLLSSVAMLMVGAVSLGTATYAWFTQNAVATAKGLNVHTQQNSNILLSETGQDNTWGYTVDYGYEDQLMLPSSTANFTNFFTGNAADGDATGALDTTSLKAATNSGTDVYYISKDLFIKAASLTEEEEAAGGIDVKWNLTVDSEAANYLRVALVEVAPTGRTVSVWSEDTTELTTKGINNAQLKDGAVQTTDYKSQTTKTATFASKIKADGTNQYKIVVWFEGQDEQCNDLLAGQTADVSFTFEKVKASN